MLSSSVLILLHVYLVDNKGVNNSFSRCGTLHQIQIVLACGHSGHSFVTFLNNLRRVSFLSVFDPTILKLFFVFREHFQYFLLYLIHLKWTLN